MADYMQAPRRNALLGVLADATRAVDDYAQRPDSTMPMGKANALLSVLSRFAGVPAVASTLDRLSYGDSLTTGTGQTLRVRPEVVEAAMAAAPVVSAAGKMAGRGANALADASVRAITGNPQATAVNALAYARGMAPVNPLTVWHGSPHKFERFDASKIGTGEGAQSYGHGIYVAESPDVAKSYQQTLGKTVIEGANVPDQPIYKAAAYAYEAGGGTLDGALRYAKSQNWTQEGLDAIKALDGASFHQGALYKVDLPDEVIAKMLDWDKPLSQQAPEVQQAVAKIKSELTGPFSADMTGDQLLRHIQATLKSVGQGDIKAEGLLRERGIPGIRYLDGGSRGAGGGTSNFVVFPGEENALTILERNGKPVR